MVSALQVRVLCLGGSKSRFVLVRSFPSSIIQALLLLFAIGLALPGYALLGTIGRQSGKPRRTPVGDGRFRNRFGIVAGSILFGALDSQKDQISRSKENAEASDQSTMYLSAEEGECDVCQAGQKCSYCYGVNPQSVLENHYCSDGLKALA
jgi:hypothetical protein